MDPLGRMSCCHLIPVTGMCQRWAFIPIINSFPRNTPQLSPNSTVNVLFFFICKLLLNAYSVLSTVYTFQCLLDHQKTVGRHKRKIVKQISIWQMQNIDKSIVWWKSLDQKSRSGFYPSKFWYLSGIWPWISHLKQWFCKLVSTSQIQLHLFLYIKLYWNIAMLICLHIKNGYNSRVG